MASLGNSTLDYISYLNTFSFHSCTFHFNTSIALKSFTCHSRYFSACHSASCIHTSRYAVSNTVLYILRILAILLYFAAQVSCNRNLRCIWRGPAPSRWAVTWFLSHFYLSAFWQQQHLLCAELGGHRVPQLSLLPGALCLHILVPTEAVQQNRYARGNYEMTYQLLHIFTQISFGLCLIVQTVKVSCVRVDVSGLKITDNECYSKIRKA